MTEGRSPSPTAPLVSVVVPVHNRRRLLRAALQALEHQTYASREVVVVDDASTDGSADEAEAFAARDSRVVVLRLGEQVGAVAARTAGIAEARGSILAFTDSDCVPSPTWLETMVLALEGDHDVVQGLTRPTGPVGPLERSLWADREDGLYPTCNIAYRRAAFDRAGGFEPRGEALLGFRAGRRAKGLGFGEDALLGWRVRRTGATAFRVDAVVEHQVLPFEPTTAVSRAWQAGAFAALVREIPELRTTLLHRRVLLGRRRQVELLAGVALGAVAVSTRHGGRLVAAAGATSLLVRWLLGQVARVDRSDPRWPAHVGVLAGLEVVSEAALVTGSVRTGTLVL